MEQEYKIYWARHRDHTDINTQGYIGVSVDLERREDEHRNSNSCIKFHNALKKYGDEVVFEVVNSFDDPDHAYWLEQYIRPKPDIGWNLAVGGLGGSKGPQSEETIEKRSKSMLGKNTGKKLSPRTDEHKEKLRKANLGKVFTEEHKNNMSKAKLGVKKGPQSEETIEKISKSMLGKNTGKIPWNKGIPQSEETKEKNRKGQLKRWANVRAMKNKEENENG